MKNKKELEIEINSYPSSSLGMPIGETRTKLCRSFVSSSDD